MTYQPPQPQPPLPPQPQPAPFGIFLPQTTVSQLWDLLGSLWANHKIASVILATIFGGLSFGTFNYWLLKNDSEQLKELQPKYKVIVAEKTALDDKIIELRNQSVHYQSIKTLIGQLERRLQAISYALSAQMFGSTDIHDSQTLRKDELAWEVLGEFSDFVLETRNLIETLKLEPSLKENSINLTIGEAIHYAVLKGKFYQASKRRDDFRATLAKERFLVELEEYEKKFSSSKHYSEYLRGLYVRDLQNPPDSETALKHFEQSLDQAKSKKVFWPAPLYAKLSIYEEKGDLKTIAIVAEQLKREFESRKITLNHLYLSTLQVLVEAYFAQEGPSSSKGKDTLDSLQSIMKVVKKDPRFERFTENASELDVFRKGIHVLNLLETKEFGQTVVELKELESDRNNTSYFKNFLTRIVDYGEAEVIISKDSKDPVAIKRLDAAISGRVDEKGNENGSPVSLLKWIKTKAENRKAQLLR